MATDAEMVSMYSVELLSVPQISGLLSVPKSQIYSRLRDNNVKIRTREEAVRVRKDVKRRRPNGVKRVLSEQAIANITAGANARWKGKALGKRTTQSGYVEFTVGENKGRLEHVS